MRRPHNKIDLTEFIRRSRLVHGDTYDYSESVYRGADKKIKIVCSEHGAYETNARVHMNGSICPKCSRIQVPKTKTANYGRSFVKRAVSKHGNLYDYSSVVYVNSKTPVEIICPTHGPFWQVPVSHTKGFGCARCAGVSRLSTEEFIKTVDRSSRYSIRLFPGRIHKWSDGGVYRV